MPRYIDADWITQKLEGWQDQLAETYGQNDEYVLCLGEVLMKLDDTPTADVPDRKVGEWTERKVIEDGTAIEEWQSARCSVCGKYHTTPYLYYFDDFAYCPNCGAEMKGEDDGI